MNIINLLDTYIVKSELRDRTAHYPSDANTCRRQLFYKWTKVAPSNPMDASAIYKMQMGNAIHDLLFKLLKEAGLTISNEIAFKYKSPFLKYEISGRIDNVFIDADGIKYGIEIKSSYGKGIIELVKQKQPKREALIQVSLYLFCTDIKKFYIIYFGRDNAYRTQFEVTKDDDNKIYINNQLVAVDFYEVISKFKQIEEAVDSNKIPDRDYNVIIKDKQIKEKIQKDKIIYKSDWQCMYCVYKNECWKDKL